jgi:arginine exporter protein ArgO
VKTTEDFMKFQKSFIRSLCLIGGLLLASTGYAAAEQKPESAAPKKTEKKEVKKEKAPAKEVKKMNPNAVVVTMVTNKGTIKIELDKE